MNNLIDFNLKDAIHDLVFDIPSPTPGISKVVYDFYGLCKVEFCLNPINKIPLPGADLKLLFKYFSMSAITEILKYVLLEIPILFFCQDKFTLVNVVKSFVEIILPFKYQYPVIPILPKIYYRSLERFTCFIAGINRKYTEEFFVKNGNVNLNNKDYVIVNISYSEGNEINQNSKFSLIKKSTEKYNIILQDPKKNIVDNSVINYSKDIESIRLPKYYLQKLIKNLNQLFYEKTNTFKNIYDVNVEDIAFSFYYYFTAVFMHIDSFLISDETTLINNYSKVENDTIKISELFKIDEFIAKEEESNMDFFGYFITKTKIWRNFIIKKLYPMTIDEKLEILLFDEMIRWKKNKKIQQLINLGTPFLNSKNFDITKSEKIKSNNSMKKNNRNSSQRISQVINNFPLLNDTDSLKKFNDYLKSDKKIKNLYQEYYLTCINLLKDKKVQECYNSNITDNIKPDNEKYGFKLWTLILCYNFKNLNVGERWPLFNELLSQIKQMLPMGKIKNLDPFLSDLLFNTIIKYGDKEMVSLLYKELNEVPCVGEDYLIFLQLISKFIRKNDVFKISLPKLTTLKERNYNILNLRSGTKLGIVLIEFCSQCKLCINLKPILLNSSGLNTDKLMAKCLICHNERPANVTITFGEEKKDKKMELFTPKYLYNYMRNLGEFNSQTFYKEHLEIFLNLIIIFQVYSDNYDFLFPYKTTMASFGFNPDKLEKTTEEGYSCEIKKTIKHIKWYEEIEPDKNISVNKKRFSKTAKRGSIVTFNTNNVSSASFFENQKKNQKSGSRLKTHISTQTENLMGMSKIINEKKLNK